MMGLSRAPNVSTSLFEIAPQDHRRCVWFEIGVDADSQTASLSMLPLLNDMSNEAASVAIAVLFYFLSAYLNCLLFSCR